MEPVTSATGELHRLSNVLGALLLEIELTAEDLEDAQLQATLHGWAQRLEEAARHTAAAWSAVPRDDPQHER